MKSQMIVKSNIFDKINNYMSIDMVKQLWKQNTWHKSWKFKRDI